MNRILRTDADAATFIGEQLQYLYPRLIATVYTKPEWAKHLPLETGSNPAVGEMGFDIYTATGMAEMFRGDGRNLPEVGSSRERVMTPVHQYGINRTLSDWAAEQAALEAQRLRQLGQTEGVAIDQAEEAAAAEAVAQRHETLALTGDSALGILGLINQPNIGSYPAPNGASGSALWEAKTGDEIVADLTGLLSLVMTTAKSEQFFPDRLLLPLNKFLTASTRKMEGTNESALSYFQRTNPRGTLLKIESWVRLNGQGTGSTGLAFCYKFSDDVLSYRAPLAYFVHQPARAPAGWVWTHSMRSAGVGVKRPFAVGKMQGF